MQRLLLPQTLFLSTFVCCAKKTNTPVDFFLLLKFYTRKSKKMSAFFLACTRRIDKKNDTNDNLGGGLSHTTKISLVLAFYVPGWYFWNLCPPAFIHSSIQFWLIYPLYRKHWLLFQIASSLSTQHAQYAHARRKGVIKKNNDATEQEEEDEESDNDDDDEKRILKRRGKRRRRKIQSTTTRKKKTRKKTRMNPTSTAKTTTTSS